MTWVWFIVTVRINTHANNTTHERTITRTAATHAHNNTYCRHTRAHDHAYTYIGIHEVVVTVTLHN